MTRLTFYITSRLQQYLYNHLDNHLRTLKKPSNDLISFDCNDGSGDNEDVHAGYAFSKCIERRSIEDCFHYYVSCHDEGKTYYKEIT